MKITCQSCQSKYTVSDDKVQGKTVKIKCRKCGATILVNSSGVTTNGAGAADAAAPTALTYTVNVADGDQRTMTLQEIVEAYNAAVVNADTYVWADGMGDWQPLGQVEAISSALQAAGGAARAARKEDDRRQDVFGGGNRPAADDVATSSPLFGGGAGAAAKPKANEENSMLFSLSALTAKAAPSATTALNRDDSGIIDLKALAAAAEARNKAHTPAPVSAAGISGLSGGIGSGIGGGMGGGMSSSMDDGGLFLAPPVLSAAPAAPAIETPMDMPQKNRTPLFIGIGATVAVLAIVGAFMAMRGGEEVAPTPTAATTPTAAPTETVAPVPTPAETVAAPTATASATAAPVAKTGGGTRPVGGGTGTKPPAGGGGTAAKPPAGGGAPAGGATPPPKKGGCGCAPGDLMCAMKCSTK